MSVFSALKLILHYPFTFYPVFPTLRTTFTPLFCTCTQISHFFAPVKTFYPLPQNFTAVKPFITPSQHPHAFTFYPLPFTAYFAYLIKPSKIVHDCILPVYPSQYSTLNLKRNYERFCPQI